MMKIFTSKKFLGGFFSGLLLLTPFVSQAVDIEKEILQFFANALYYLMVYIPGKLFALVARIMEAVLQYNGFADESAITLGWTVMRDVSNMFFIVILLTIAIGTILKSQRYGYQQNLRRLIIMAILINFSKTITLFFIELSQAITIYFVNTFADQLQVGMMQLLGITGSLNLENSAEATPFDSQNVTGANILFRIFLAGIMVIVGTIVVAVITILFVLRIVTFAFIIILSPIAFAASTLPTAVKYYQEWWDEFGKYLLIGPVLAFFLWLSFTMVSLNTMVGSSSIIANSDKVNASSTAESLIGDKEVPRETTAGIAIQFFFGISFLLGALMMSQKIGVAGASIASKASGQITGFGRRAAGRIARTTAAPFGKGAEAFAGLLDKGEGALRKRPGGNFLAGMAKVGSTMVGGGIYTGALRRGASLSQRSRQTAVAERLKTLKDMSDTQLQNEIRAKGGSVGKTLRRVGFGADGIAAAAESQRRGLTDPGSTAYGQSEKDNKLKQSDKSSILAMLEAGGPETAEQAKTFKRDNIHLLDVDKRKQALDQMSYEGEGVVKKHAARQDWAAIQSMTPEVQHEIVQGFLDAGLKQKDLESMKSGMSKPAGDSFDKVFYSHVKALDANVTAAREKRDAVSSASPEYAGLEEAFQKATRDLQAGVISSMKLDPKKAADKLQGLKNVDEGAVAARMDAGMIVKLDDKSIIKFAKHFKTQTLQSTARHADSTGELLTAIKSAISLGIEGKDETGASVTPVKDDKVVKFVMENDSFSSLRTAAPLQNAYNEVKKSERAKTLEEKKAEAKATQSGVEEAKDESYFNRPTPSRRS